MIWSRLNGHIVPLFPKNGSCFPARAAALSNEQKQKIENNNMKQLVAPKPPNKEYKLNIT